MKKTFRVLFVFTVITLFTSGLILAQSSPIDKGSKIIAGELAFSSASGDLYENSDGDGVTSIEADPFFAYFIAPGLAVGANLLFESESQGDYSQSGWGIGPRVIYFIGSNGPTYPYVDVSFLYMSGSWDTGENDYSWSGNMIRFGGGVMHMITSSVGLFGGVAYSIDSMKPEDGDSESGSQFHIAGGLAVFLH
ncbi:MAG: hypothetical protein V2J62_04810 [candidate division KSB1 bacterium]|jgi:hypothetical protein|nr:hypothetical protein [candidate division KSB1 bacterium]